MNKSEEKIIANKISKPYSKQHNITRSWEVKVLKSFSAWKKLNLVVYMR